MFNKDNFKQSHVNSHSYNSLPWMRDSLLFVIPLILHMPVVKAKIIFYKTFFHLQIFSLIDISNHVNIPKDRFLPEINHERLSLLRTHILRCQATVA